MALTKFRDAKLAPAEEKYPSPTEYLKFYINTSALVYLQRYQAEASVAQPNPVRSYFEFQQRLQNLSDKDKMELAQHAKTLPEYKTALARGKVAEKDTIAFNATHFLILANLFEIGIGIANSDQQHYLADQCFENAFILASAAKNGIDKFNRVFALLTAGPLTLSTCHGQFDAHNEMQKIFVADEDFSFACGILAYSDDSNSHNVQPHNRDALTILNQAGCFHASFLLGKFSLDEANELRKQLQQRTDYKQTAHDKAKCQAHEQQGFAELKSALKHGHTDALNLLTRYYFENGRYSEVAHCVAASLKVLSLDPSNQNFANDSKEIHDFVTNRNKQPRPSEIDLSKFSFKDWIHILINIAQQEDAQRQRLYGQLLREYVTQERRVRPSQNWELAELLIQVIHQNFLANPLQTVTPPVDAYPVAFAHAVVCLAEDCVTFQHHEFLREEGDKLEMIQRQFQQLVQLNPDIFLEMHSDFAENSEAKAVTPAHHQQSERDLATVVRGGFLTAEMQARIQNRRDMLAVFRTIRWNNKGSCFTNNIMSLFADYAEPTPQDLAADALKSNLTRSPS